MDGHPTRFNSVLILFIAGNDPISLSPTNAVVPVDELTININYEANSRPNITVDRLDGIPIPDKDTRITIGVDSIVFRSLNSLDAGNYTIGARNEAGTEVALLVLCEFDYDHLLSLCT